MALSIIAGMKISISTLPAASTVDTATEFAALTYTELGYVENVGAYGDTSQDVSFTPISTKRTIHFAGSRDAGTTAFTVGSDPADAGQDAFDLAFTNNQFEYALKIEAADKLSLAGTNTINYYRARVMAQQNQGGDANTVARKLYNVGLNTAPVEVAAT